MAYFTRENGDLVQLLTEREWKKPDVPEAFPQEKDVTKRRSKP
jgi:hypothetical protein